MMKTFMTAWCVLSVLATMAFAQRTEKEFAALRSAMVETAIVGAGITNERVIQSIRDTRRHEFMPRDVRDRAYLDAGVPIGEKQTISSPFIVAYMTESLEPQATDKVLEIGTGSGYQAAVLSPLVAEVYSIEIVESLGRRAARTLNRLNYDNVFTKVGDGFKGWPDAAPFDKIIVTCSPEDIPQPLIDQLKEGGTIVVPIGERYQQTLYSLRKVNGEMERETLRPTLFVPMTGKAETAREVKPDGSNPTLLNPDFEEGVDENGFVRGWYYQRLTNVVEDRLSPAGEHHLTFENDVPGQHSHLMQGFPIDGRLVSSLKFSGSAKCDSVAAGLNKNEVPLIALSFYDKDRQSVGGSYLGPMRGTQSWENFSKTIDVPVGTREAILRIGLFGATGSASFDNIRVKKVE